jgi:CheY-like chemotaxis protein
MARVLLIDDDQSNLEFMRQLLQIEGHELAQLRSAIRRCLGQERQ